MPRRTAVALALLAMTLSPQVLPAQKDAALERARRILREAPLVDGHNDVAWEIRTSRDAPFDVERYDLAGKVPGHTDLARLAAGGVGAQFWSIYVPGDLEGGRFARVQLEQFDIARRMVARYPDRLSLALTADDIDRAARERKVASLLGMEGGHVLENSLGALRAYYDLGARYLTLTHNVTLDWADAGSDEHRHGGLTPFGMEVVREMNRLGMLVDLSHVSPGVMSDALDVAEAPVIFSHSSARALVDVPRNVPDSILRRLPKNGGVVMVTFVPSFVSAEAAEWDRAAGEFRKTLPADTAARRAAWQEWRAAHPRPRATLAQVADHIEHVRKVAGIDHVAIGSDFDGIEDTPVGLEDVSKFPDLLAELVRRGWSDGDLKKLARLNVVRALRQAEQAAARLRSARAPSVRTIEQLDGPAARSF
ncbi:MAG TPA: dipeptidase, partial [Gemmatimonadales bacterium]|nr:dipeptidase [Gemmatimonadales bacterium]